MKKEADQIAEEMQGNVPEEKFITKAYKEKLDEIHEYKRKQVTLQYFSFANQYLEVPLFHCCA